MHDDELIIVVPLRTKGALAEAWNVLEGNKFSDKRKPVVNWSGMNDAIGLSKLLHSTNPLSLKEASYATVEEMTDTSEEQRLKPETNRFKREVDLRQTNAIYKQFLSPAVKKKAISDQAKHMIKKLEKDVEVGGGQRRKATRRRASYQFSPFGLFPLEIKEGDRGRHLFKRPIRPFHPIQ